MTVKKWAQCIKITRTDDEVIALTELDRDIVYDSVTYKANPSFDPSALDNTASLSVNNAETGGFFSLVGIDKEDVIKGLYDGAEVSFLLINWGNNTLVKTLGVGNLGEATLTDDRYSIEYRSIGQKLQQPVGRVFAENCDARLGNAACKVDLATYTETGSITTVTSAQVIEDDTRTEVDGFFAYGNLTFTSGANAGASREVKLFSDGVFTLFLPFSYVIEEGDEYEVYAGCDKKKTTCRDKFSNIINFQGFPDKPQRDKASKFGGQ